MTRQRITTKVLTLLTLTLVVLGFWQIGSGSWIYVKARNGPSSVTTGLGLCVGRYTLKPWPWADTWPVARLVVPSLGIDQIAMEVHTDVRWLSGLGGSNHTLQHEISEQRS